MNYKLEKFWNSDISRVYISIPHMNYKLEKFWNSNQEKPPIWPYIMNYKLEKFWNAIKFFVSSVCPGWTINLKSFEIICTQHHILMFLLWTINLKSFEILT